MTTPYVPAEKSPPELTFRGLFLGSILGVLFAASSIYLAVRVGLTVSASIPIAVLSIALFRSFGRSEILENTIVQTTGSAGESLAFGVAAALPALLFLGYEIDLVHAFLVAALGGVLGVLMMIPLRHGLIVEEHGHLTYPEGTACADVLIAGDRGGTTARTVVVGFIAGGLYKLGYAALKLWKEVVTVSTRAIGLAGGSVSLEVSPELLGVGYIIGPRISGVQFAGGVLSYLVLIPAIRFFGGGLDHPLFAASGLLIRDMAPDQIRNAYVLYVGAGAVATGGLISLLRSLPTIAGAFRRGLASYGKSRGPAVVLPRTERDLPMSVVVVGSALLLLAIWLSPPLHVNFLSAMLILFFGFFFVTVSARITGEIGSSSNPISGMVVATLLVTCLVYVMLGWTSPGDRFAALTTAAIVGIAASNGGTTAQDLKTAFLVGGTPRRQQISLFVGVLTSAALIGGTLVLLNEGSTAIIPEAHPGVTLSEVSTTKTRTQLRAEFRPAPGTDMTALRRGLWAKGYELRDLPEGQEVRSFSHLDVQELRSLFVTLPEGAVPLDRLGAIPGTRPVTYAVGYARSGANLPAGKYLVSPQGEIEYLVDPGIGGRVSEYLGQKLTRYDAPKARLFSLIIDGILTRKLPWNLVLLGVFLALMLELCGVASLPFAVGVYLPISTSTPIFVGGLVRHFIDRRRRQGGAAEGDSSPGTLLSSGYIAGGAIAGVGLALLALPRGGAWLEKVDVGAQLAARLGGTPHRWVEALGDGPGSSPWASGLWAVLCFLSLVTLLVRTGLGGAKKIQAR